ncbi:hypothetical protein BEWA_035530 [Theileria equi strain WA]|uniref:Signal peptide containing protein n=1 Tax=Theileria equi strain WA TaxID=1537102 RepID=L1LDJ0_THEEQ|nr:hypothetical protein BEWA_035530 [Theileria equi strain WA]EKX73517.1 hypothetical protein BEWA_035530 [Theileria equi strain WA]|eukprot:XP_004832969.1 hypothetical protein BEWA_035530 [Theileria equi strain WA]
MNVLLRLVIPATLAILRANLTKSSLVDGGAVGFVPRAEDQLVAFNPPKTPIDIDVAGETPDMVLTQEALGNPSATSYTVKPEHYDSHIIGDVLDNGEVILEANTMVIERRVYFQDEGDARIIRVSDMFLIAGGGGLDCETTELVKRKGYYQYEPLARYPVDLDLLSNDLPNEIERTVDESSGKTIFKIRPHLINCAYICIVSYGDCLLANGRGCYHVFSREVTVDSLDGFLLINVLTCWNNGCVSNSKHILR